MNPQGSVYDSDEDFLDPLERGGRTELARLALNKEEQRGGPTKKDSHCDFLNVFNLRIS